MIANRIKPIVELATAYAWYCPDCGADNYCRSELVNLTPVEKRAAMALGEGCDASEILLTDAQLEQINFRANPRRVTCFNCGQWFESKVEEEIDLNELNLESHRAV